MTGTVVPTGLFADRYALEGELGSGASAVVYRARDLQRGHAVAIKLLRTELAQSVGADGFLREIRVTQQLHHPNIVPVLDSGRFGEQLYFVLPLMEGGTLRQRLAREKQLPVADAVAITRQVSAALDHAHQQNLVHRDVKPGNILFTSGQACLADFGIARALERALDEPTTSTSIVRGTPPYMSPEQASGEKDLDGRSDIYSLACVVYEMLAGMQPFVGPTPQSVIAQRLAHPPRPLSVYRRGIPAAMERVLGRALSIVPADRYATAGEFAAALDAAQLEPEETATVSGVLTGRRLPWAILVAAGVAVTIFLGVRGSGSGWNAIPEGDRRRLAVMYFDILTPDDIPAYVATGLSEDLIDQLGSVRTLHVTSPAGVRPFRSGNVPVDSIGRALKVGTIVTGSLARVMDTLRVTVRLVDAATGKQLFSSTAQSLGRNLLALQDSLADKVAFLLRQRIGAEIALSESRRGARSQDAWELAQLASAEMQLALAASARRDGLAARSYAHADSLFAQAERIDPSWILPRVKRGRLALAMANLQVLAPPGMDSVAYFALSPPDRRLPWFRRALELADAAVRHTPGSADAFELRGQARFLLLGGRADDTLAAAAEKDLQTAVRLRPDVANGWASLAQLLYSDGRFDDAAVAARRAFEADAFFETRRTLAVAMNASLYAEQFGEASRWCAMGQAHYRDDPRFAECKVSLLGWTGRGRRDVDAGWRVLHEIEARDSTGVLRPSWAQRRLLIAAILARSGMRDSARALLRLVEQREGVEAAGRSALPAEAYVLVLLNDRLGAVARLEAFLRRVPGARRQTARHPWFRPLADDPRFLTLVTSAQ